MPIAQMLAPAVAAAPVPPPGQDLPRPRDVRLHTRGLVGALNAEWSALVRDPAACAAVTRWATAHPALAGHRDLAAVVDAARERGRDDALRALLGLTRDGDALAARTALQAMLGAAVRLARRTVAHAGGDHEESLARAVAALWQVVREYPFERRHCRPVDGISLDVLALLTGGGRPRFVEVPAGLPAELAGADAAVEDDDEVGVRGAFWASAHPGAGGACSDEQLVLLLAWGVRRRVVTLDEATLLLRLHSPRVPGTTVTCRDLADELGVGHATLRQRASRATRRLAGAVAERAAGVEGPRRLAA
jgi:hypothetical protein